MAVRKLHSAYPILPEGEQVIRIKEVDSSKYNDFDKLTIIVENAAGITGRVNFNFVNDDGSPNDIAEGIYSRMCRAALNDQTLDECDFDDLPGCYALVDVKHREYNGNAYADIKKWLGHADEFDRQETAKKVVSTEPKKMTAAQRIAAMRAKKS